MNERVQRWRWPTFLLLGATGVVCWLGFMIVHEIGHVLVARCTGGRLNALALHPLEISWSAFSPNPRPLLVAWGGPMLGSLLPLAGWGLAEVAGLGRAYLLRAFAGFCLLANGAYLLVDAFERSGDGGALLRHGAALWQMLLFGAVTLPMGAWLWRGLSPRFGLARGTEANRRDGWTMLVLAAVIVALELWRAE
ncbi:MAG: M50 family metallopeptidase [Verrucomicrobia bacterium]|nr:M50 family metallopeptidase [Verrucomicrobiota bacterium]